MLTVEHEGLIPFEKDVSMKVCITTLLSLFYVGSVVADDKKPEMKKEVINTICPLSGKAVVADAPTKMFDGKKVGFCCPNCPKAFAKLSKEEKGEKLTAAAKKGEPVNATCPMKDGKDVTKKGEFVIFDYQKVGFCCAGCKGKFEALSDKEKAKELAKAKKAEKKTEKK